MSREVVILGKKRDEKSNDGEIGMMQQVVPAAAKDLEPVRKAVDKLRDGIVQRFNSSDYVTLAMHVNLHTAKADLIPIPYPENIRKLKDNFNNLPTKVQDVIRKNIPGEQMKAVEEIYEYLENQENTRKQLDGMEAKAIEEKGSQDR